MPKPEDDAPTIAACHGCAIETVVNEDGYCPICLERRADDPVITVQGRTMLLSELRMQAEHDEHLAAALDGDTVKEQIKAARGDQ